MGWRGLLIEANPLAAKMYGGGDGYTVSIYLCLPVLCSTCQLNVRQLSPTTALVQVVFQPPTLYWHECCSVQQTSGDILHYHWLDICHRWHQGVYDPRVHRKVVSCWERLQGMAPALHAPGMVL